MILHIIYTQKGGGGARGNLRFPLKIEPQK